MSPGRSDEPARRRIRTELGTNLLVEAGAGSGKTTLLVERMVEHVRVGTPVERLAAVTFTRKAANELRERFQIALEAAARDDGERDAGVFRRALRDLDRAFLGTIHAFCGRLLREHPLEIGLDPNFVELTEEEFPELRADFWRRWVERATRGGNPDVAELAAMRVTPAQLVGAFAQVVAFPDVAFPLSSSAAPDAAPCRRQLEHLLERAEALMPRVEPPEGWDPLMRLVRRLQFQRRVADWNDVARFCEALEGIGVTHLKFTQKRWAADREATEAKEAKAAAKALGEDWLSLIRVEATELLRCWREHRYPVVMRLLQAAAREFERERHETGQLGFEDLLLLAARLLRERPRVREALGARYAHLFVDEFQDTDPVQAEVCFLLASSPDQGTDWRRVTPRPGSLFVVGDPKQSIYRFRRADIQVYEIAKARIAEHGAVVALTSNFRSVSSIEAVVNSYFERVFPKVATPEQAAYRPMETHREPEGADGVYRYCLRVQGVTSAASVAAEDAHAIAAWISNRITDHGRSAGDFLILTAGKPHIAEYARALAARNIPASTTGAPLPQEHELRELLLLLAAIADPDNAVLVAAALEGLFFGLSPADLWSGSRAGLRFTASAEPSSSSDALPMGAALRQLHEWWLFSQGHPADVLLDRLLDDTGLLYHAASAELGEARAGALLHLVGAVRASAAERATGLTDMMERLDTLLASEAPDALLRPGRTDAVRVMNLHKAKGLEAEVVILAAPVKRTIFEPTIHVSRNAAGDATGALVVRFGDRVIAQPPGWAALQEIEEGFAAAERERLLYVATTRARRELVVSQCETTYATRPPACDTSAWRPLAEVLEEHSLPLPPAAMQAPRPPGRRIARIDGHALRAEVQRARARIRESARPGFAVASVTESAKRVDPEPEPLGSQFSFVRTDPGAGVEWGRVVHRAIEALGRGRRGDSLEAYVRALAGEAALDAARTDALLAVVEDVQRSDEWKRLVATGPIIVEMPLMHRTVVNGVEQITEGVIDAAALGADGWFVVDWKSDAVSDAEWERRLPRYERQVELYAEMLRAMTGKPARGVVKRLGAPESSAGHPERSEGPAVG